MRNMSIRWELCNLGYFLKLLKSNLNLVALKKIWIDKGFESFRSAQIDELAGGHTALHVACHQGHCDIIRELLERGANIDILVSNIYLNFFLYHLCYFLPRQKLS